MAKSQKTYELEEIITLATARKDRVGCAEVTLGNEGIVDYVSIELGGRHIVRCYELKISRSDFLSDAKKTFVGEYNYYVIPSELWGEIRNHVEPGVGVWCVTKTGRAYVQKKAKARKCKLSKKMILMQVLRALNRENVKHNEEKWTGRQVLKPALDRRGAPIEEGDAILYSGEPWTVSSVEYAKNGTEMTPICVIENSDNTMIRVKPSMIEKIHVEQVL